MTHSKVQGVDFAKVAFSSVFSDHMFSAEFHEGRWSEGLIQPYAPIPLAPSISALHYGVSVFEGMKAHKSLDGRPLLFRPQENARRFQRSAARLAMAPVPESLFLDGLRELVRLDSAWIPPSDVGALYIRPILFSTDPSIRVKPADRYRFLIFTSLSLPITQHPWMCWSANDTYALFRAERAIRSQAAITPLRS